MAEPRPRPHEPLVSGVRDGVEHGYRALETVLEGMRRSLQRVAPAPPRRPTANGAARNGGRPVTGSHHDPRRVAASSPESGAVGRRPLGELVGVMTELLSYAGDVAVDVAGGLTGAAGGGRAAPVSPGALALSAPPTRPGGRTRAQFHLHNQRASAAGPVTFTATGLAGADSVLPAEGIHFDPPSIDRIGPHQHAEVDIVIQVPRDTPPGRYRGIVHATIGDAWAVVEVEVLDPRHGPGSHTSR